MLLFYERHGGDEYGKKSKCKSIKLNGENGLEYVL